MQFSWRTVLVAGALGGLAVLGFEPFSLPAAVLPASTLAIAGLYWLVSAPAHSRQQGFVLGLAYGLGCFLGGVSWVYVSMADFAGLTPALSALATLVFCGYLALFPALVSSLFVRWRHEAHSGWNPWLLASLWSIGEWLRGTLLTGFPWLAIGYAHTPPSPLAGYAAVSGVYGVGFMAVASAALLIHLVQTTGRRRLGVALVLLTVNAAGALLSAMPWTEPTGDPVRVRLLQGDIPQSLKWDPARVQLSFDRYLALAHRQDPGGRKPALIVLPETALPVMFDLIPRDYLARLASRSDVLLGSAVRTADDGYTNAAVGLKAGMAAAPQVYAKHHLVPFGEYSPPGFAWFFELLRIPMSAFSAGPVMQPPLDLGGQQVAANICYEDLFGEELLASLRKTSLLVNLSNTAWFGRSLAQPQHLQIARLRALESGRVMLRATNSGLTAMITPDGEVSAQLAPFTTNHLDVEAQGYRGLTPYAKWGNALILVIAVSCIALARRRR